MPKQSIIITGGASGIGHGITTYFASKENTQGTHITILDVNPATGNQALTAFKSKFPNASISFLQCDVLSWEEQARAFERVYSEQGRVDVVVANAGITEKGSLFPLTTSESGDCKNHKSVHDDGPRKPDLSTIEVNFLGVLYSVQLAIHYISKNTTESNKEKGSIICTASNAGLYAFPIAPIYSATKHGVIGLVRSLARSVWEKERIRINALAPAVIETNIAPDRALFKSMVITPMSTATKAVEMLVSDMSLNGKVAELHGETVSFAEQPAYVDEDTGRNIETFWSLGYA